MIQNILCYAAGSKGDLIVNFLLDKLNFGPTGDNKVYYSAVRKLDWEIVFDKFRYGTQFNVGKFENNLLDAIYGDNNLLVNCHTLHLFSNNFLDQIKSLSNIYLVNHKNYLVNVEFDAMFKKNFNEFSHNNKLYRLIYKKKYNLNIEHWIDTRIIPNSSEINDDIRFDYFINNLQNLKVPWEKSKEDSFQILDYEKLFLPPYEDMQLLADKVGEKFNKESWANAISKSFLPKQINAFGKIICPDDYGYIRY